MAIEWKDITAAMDGISECPGDPWETSIPRMMVGTLETIGIEGECSTANNEFNPPSCKQDNTQDTINTMTSGQPKIEAGQYFKTELKNTKE